jgi:hypothetical protein
VSTPFSRVFDESAEIERESELFEKQLWDLARRWMDARESRGFGETLENYLRALEEHRAHRLLDKREKAGSAR